ncbi:hypothetical protein PENSPDRAFT_631924 [Peniophora sp. CONT]|nr:hypothetical protein PENSPDRAFT_631924 [Peniophora sp. CONT]
MGTLKRSLSPSSTSSAPTSKRQKMDVDLSPLPPSELTLALPGLLARPPTHPQHAAGLALSRSALGNLLSTPSQLPTTESQSRAWIQLAELSIQSLPLIPPNSDEEANTISEIDRALSKALNLAPVTQRSLRAHVTLLQVQMAAGRGQGKFAHKMLSRLLSGFTTSDEPAIVYATRLAKIQLSLSAPRPPPTTTTTTTEDEPPRTPSADKDPALTDLHAALDGIRDLRSAADKAGQGHEHVSLLSCVLRVGVVVTRGLWSEAESAVRDAEEALGLSYPESPRPGEVRRTSTGNTVGSGSSAPTVSEKGKEMERKEETFVMFEDPFEATCAAHILLYAVVAYTHIGDAQGAAYRLSHLHALLDEGVLSAFLDGVAEIPLPTGPPLHVRTTPPRILFALGYLVSASAKRDPVGRKPKRATFAQAGLDNLEEKEGPGFEWPVWMSVQDVEDAGYAMIRIRADLLSEMAGVSIHRNDFAKADEMLDKLIALTRTHGLWDRYAPRVTLHHAHLAHARLDHERALICYDTAAYLGARGGAGAEGDFVALAARAGAVLLRVGLLPPDDEEVGGERVQVREEEEVREVEEVEEVVVPKGKGKAKGGPKKRKGAPRKAKGKAKAVVEPEDEQPTASTSTSTAPASSSSTATAWTRAQIIEEAERVSKACMGQGGTLEMAGAVVKAVVSAEILRSKAHLRRALTLATSSGSNHTRAALLALGAAHYARTDPPHALDALRGADVLAAGLGAAPKPSDVDSNATGGGGAVTGLGNVALRLWCGERKLELFRRAGPGESERAKRQEERNGVFREALEALRAQVHHR